MTIAAEQEWSIVCSRHGTGQDFPDPTGKFQNLRRLTARSTGF